MRPLPQSNADVTVMTIGNDDRDIASTHLWMPAARVGTVEPQLPEPPHQPAPHDTGVNLAMRDDQTGLAI